MLHIHFSNRLEVLRERLLDQLQDPPDGDVFTASQVIVPSAAVRRWLTLAIARRQGVCARVEFPYLAQWLWQPIGRVVPAVAGPSPFAPETLVWRVLAAFEDAGFTAAHPRLSNWLDDADGVMRYELAQQVAGLMEHLLTYRPDWVAAWGRHQRADLPGSGTDARVDTQADEAWQAALWRRLTAEMGLGAAHPALALVQALQHEDAATALGLPASAHVFALPTMPPLYIDLLQHLGRHMRLHVYVLNPCQEYWFELVPPKALGHLRARGRDAGHEVGQRLLAGWGRQTQALVDGLVQAGGDAVQDDAHFEPLPGTSLLARVHNAVLNLQEITPGSLPLQAGDRSIELHVCHSLTRELEVLHDRLLDLFAAPDPPAPGDILVVTPDLDAAAPLIDAVFGTAPAPRALPYAVTGRPPSRVNAAALALLALLDLVASRLSAVAVFALLQDPLVARRYDLDDEALGGLHDALREAGFHWGLDAAHRTAFDVPATERHTLADALDRLFLGHAVSAQGLGPAGADAPLAGLLPAGDADGAQARALGAFWRYAQDLQALHAAVSQPLAGAAWGHVLRHAQATFLQPDDAGLDDALAVQDTLATLVDGLVRTQPAQTLSLPVLRAALAQALDNPARGGVPGGAITFSSMSSLRNLPYAIVCAIGLDDGVFPGGSRTSEFDLIARSPRRGDRQRRSDDRNVFLDLLLAARRGLHLSWRGRHVRDNSALPPSVLVSELLDVLVPAVADAPIDANALARARARLVVTHPLQAFSPESFDPAGDPRQQSFRDDLAQAVRQRLQAQARPAERPPLRAAPDADDEPDPDGGAGPGESDQADDADERDEQTPQPVFFAAPLAPPGPEWRSVPLQRLLSFFGNPCRALLRDRLGVVLARAVDPLEDDEPFVPDLPAAFALSKRLMPTLLAGASPDAAMALAEAGVDMPANVLGRRAIAQQVEALHGFAKRVREATSKPCLPPSQTRLDLLLDGEAWQVHTEWSDLRAQGLVRWQDRPLGGATALHAWLHHLVLCAAPPTGVATHTQWLLRDDALELRAPDGGPEAARDHLRALLRLYRRGLSEPLHFFPRAAWAYWTNDSRISKARAAWLVTPNTPHGESADPAYQLALRGLGDPLNDDFMALAKAVFQPLEDCRGRG